MAVDLDVEDFLGDPDAGTVGIFDPTELWPGVAIEKLQARFERWIEKAGELTEILALATDDLQNDAATKRVTYNGWDNIYQFRLGNPASVTVNDKGSHGFTQGQIDAAKAERDAALLEYEDAVEVEETVEAVLVVHRSAAVPIEHRF